MAVYTEIPDDELAAFIAEYDVGELMSKYNGGGHRGAGTCLLRAEDAEAQIAELIAAMKADG